jgi:isochorismate synthase
VSGVAPAPAQAPGIAGSDPTGPSGPTAARRHLLPPGGAIDPYALAGDDGVLVADAGRILVGLGTAVTLDLPGGLADLDGLDRAQAELASITADDRVPPGTTTLRPVQAFGALPFDRTAPASLLVPSTLYCLEPDGTEWVTVVGGPDETPGRLRDRLGAAAAAHGVGVTGPPATRILPRSDDSDFEGAVAEVLAAISRDEVTKVVLARRVDVTLDRAPDLAALLSRWRALEPAGTLFSLPTPDGRFVGASPELLVERLGDRVRSRPLAGTTGRFPDEASPLPPELLESTKDGDEHRLVVEAIRGSLAPWCTSLVVPDRPELVHLHNITHLGTELTGTLRSGPDRPAPGALHLAALLHPTPAVGGVPRSAALDLIAALEDGPRGRYAGPVGYLDGTGDGRFVVGIRAMTVSGRTVTLTAGVGVVAGSRPETERDEANLKFVAVFDALAPGVAFDTSAGAHAGQA